MIKKILIISSLIYFSINLISCNWFTAPKNKPLPVEEAKMKLLWEIPYQMLGTGINAASLILGDSLVIMSAGKEIFAVKQQTGKTKWKYFVSDLTNIQTEMFVTDGSKIYITHVEDVRAVNISDGSQAWLTKMSTAERNERGAFRDKFPLIHNNKLYVSGRYTIYCLDIVDGNILWSNYLYDQLGTPVYYSNAIIVSGGRNRYDNEGRIIGSIDSIYSLDSQTGKRIWVKKVKGEGHIAKMELDNNIIYGGTYFTYNSTGFEAFNAETGELVWSYYTRNQAWSYEDCTVAGDKVFVNITLYGTAAFDKNTGALLWRKTYFTSAEFPHKKPILYNGYLYVIHGSKLYIINPDTGDEIYSYEPSDNPFGTFTVGNGKIFICGYNKLQCYEEYKPGE